MTSHLQKQVTWQKNLLKDMDRGGGKEEEGERKKTKLKAGEQKKYETEVGEGH